MTKDELILILLILMVVVLALEFAYIMLRRRKRKGEEMFRKPRDVEEGIADRAYNLILTTEGIAATLARQGIDTASADALLREARRLQDARDYGGAIERAESAKIALLRARRQADAMPPPPPPPRPAVDLSELPEPDEETGPDQEVDLNELPPYYLQAKFMLATLKDNMDKKGISSGEAFTIYREAVEMFDGKNYSRALSLAIRADRMLDTGSVMLIGDESEDAAGEEDEVLEVLVCPECEAEVSEDDVFCGSCGTRLVLEETECPECGSAADPDDRFCRKCGHKLR